METFTVLSRWVISNNDVVHRIALHQRTGEYCKCIFNEVSSCSKFICLFMLLLYMSQTYDEIYLCLSIGYVKTLGR